MCKKHNPRKIDKCMNSIVSFINIHCPNWKTVGCCCGHGKYPMTIVVKSTKVKNMLSVEIISGNILPRKKRFYKKDDEGYYYIPEIL